jgi:hypothetical protein
MKLQELAVANPTKQAAKFFESYFGDTVKFDQMTQQQAQTMLKRVRSVIAEHRRTPGFHNSERNPAYLKLVVMEQALEATATANPQQQAALQTAQVQQKKRQIQDAIKAKQKEIQDLQKEMNNPTMSTMESKRSRRLREASEIQQAQVVLASQDMVDQVQKMSEQVSAMQFKDLPALVDQIKNEVGVDQATQFNGDASAALSGLLQNLQGAKQQLEQALGVVTGQAPMVPGEDMTAGQDMGLAGEPPAEVPPGEEVVDTETEIEEPAVAGLGRERR